MDATTLANNLSLLQQQQQQQQQFFALGSLVATTSGIVAAEDEECVLYVDRDPDPTNHPVAVATFAVVYLHLFVLGLVGNLSIVVLTLRHPPLRTVQNIFILNLAIGDVIVCLLSLPFTPVTNIYKNWFFGAAICHLLPMIQAVSVFVSTLSLSAIAIDRYNLVVRPYARPLRLAGAINVAAVLWIVSVAVSLPYAAYMRLEEYPGYCGQFCSEHWPTQGVRRGYALIVLVLQFLIPFLTMSFCYAAIFSRLRERANSKMRRLHERSKLLSMSNGTAGTTTTTTTTATTATAAAVSCGATTAEKMLTGGVGVISASAPDLLADCYSAAGTPTQVGAAAAGKIGANLGGSFHNPALSTPPRGPQQLLLHYQQQKQHMRTGDELQMHSLLAQQRRTTRILVSMVMIFGLTWLPQNVLTLIIEYDENLLQSPTTNYTYLLSIVTHAIAMTTNVANPILYAWLNPTFKRLFLEAFSGCRTFHRRAGAFNPASLGGGSTSRKECSSRGNNGTYFPGRATTISEKRSFVGDNFHVETATTKVNVGSDGAAPAAPNDALQYAVPRCCELVVVAGCATDRSR